MKYRKIILLINFIFAPTFFLIASYQISKNDGILINYKSLFQEIDSPKLNHFQFLKMNKLLSNSAICLYFIKYKYKIFLKIRNGEVVGNLFSEKMIHDLLESHNFLKFGKKQKEKKLGQK